MKLTEQEIMERLTGVVESNFPDVETQDLTQDSVLVRDLGLSSMNFVVLVMKTEDEFAIRFPDSALPKMVTVRDVVREIENLTDAA